MRRMLVGSVVLLLGTTGACSSGSTESPELSSPPVGLASATPTPAAAPRTRAQDAADAHRALVSANDLGAPWIRPKTVNRSGGKHGEVCPGHVSALKDVPFTADVSTGLTEGKGVGKSIASFRLRTLPDEESAAAVLTAVEADQKACARYQDSSGFTVVRTVEGPTTVAGGDIVASWAERIYYVKPHKLAYARHDLVARQGRVVTTLDYAFLLAKADPEAKSFTTATRLLEVQLHKNADTFP